MKNFGSVILAGLAMTLYIMFLYSWGFIFLLLSSPLIYLAILVLLKVITKKEILMLIKK